MEKLSFGLFWKNQCLNLYPKNFISLSCRENNSLQDALICKILVSLAKCSKMQITENNDWGQKIQNSEN